MPYDHSQLSCFQACPERFRLRYMERLERVTDTPQDQPKRFGQALHAGLAAWYKGLGTQAVSDCFLTVFPKPLIEGEKLYTPQNGLTVLQQYLQQYGELDKSYKVVAVETPIVLVLQNSLQYLVKLDTVVEDANGVWVLEHKSTASPKAFSDTWWAQFEPNSQLSGQVAACQQQYGRCDGVILNGLSFRHGVRMGFVVACQRQVFQRTEEQVEDWRSNVLKVIDRIDQDSINLDEPTVLQQWEKNEQMCGWCAYRPLCISCGAEGVREACYKTVDNPLAYQTE